LEFEYIKVWIKDDTVKRNIDFDRDKPGDIEQDAVIFNTTKKTATAYCEDLGACETSGEVGEVTYDDYYVKTPFDWSNEITSAEKIGEVTLYDRETWIIEANDGMKVWLDNYYGIPLKVELGEISYEFSYPAFNKVDDEELGFVEIE